MTWDYSSILALGIIAFSLVVMLRDSEIRPVRLGLGFSILGLVIIIGITGVGSLPSEITFPASIVAFGLGMAGFLLVSVTKIQRYLNHPM